MAMKTTEATSDFAASRSGTTGADDREVLMVKLGLREEGSQHEEATSCLAMGKVRTDLAKDVNIKVLKISMHVPLCMYW
jgi:hypothetical protein